MPTSTYIALANYTVPSGGVASVTFSSIPATYRDLVLIIDSQCVTSSLDGIDAQFNSDTGSNYAFVLANGDGSSTSSSSNASRTSIPIGLTGTAQINTIAHIMDYSATDKHKTTLSRGNASASAVRMVAGRWANTAAITSIKLQAGSNFIAGSTFALYGIVS